VNWAKGVFCIAKMAILSGVGGDLRVRIDSRYCYYGWSL